MFFVNIFRFVRLKCVNVKVVGLVFLWLICFQLLVNVWLVEEEEPSNRIIHWTFNKNISQMTNHARSKQPIALKAIYRRTQNTNSDIFFKERQTRTTIKESHFAVVDSVSKLPKHPEAKYVVIIPHRLHNTKFGLNILERKDHRSVKFLGHMLNSFTELDGATCVARGVITKFQSLFSELDDIPWVRIFSSSWCSFARRNWSIQIRNTGKIKVLNKFIPKGYKLFTNISTPNVYQFCNIINAPLVLRKDKFVRIGNLTSHFGRLTLLDFFLRSKGKLRIGKFGNCIFSDQLFHIDRAALEGSGDFTDYSHFGIKHGILRIINEDRIEWTKCAASGKLCKEKPYVPPCSLPHVGQPVCCSVVLGKMLKDVVDVFVKLGIKHRVVYGTLLGAVRSKAIIPWSYDVDISLEWNYAENKTFFAIIQEYLKDRYYVGESFSGMSRGIPLMPPHININTTPFFDGDSDLQGDRFFSQEIEESVEELLPITTGSDWRSRGYMDFYIAPNIWWNASSVVIINGDSYTTLAVEDIEYELKNWYGENYRTPVLKGDWKGLSDKGS